jgi:hypothetical protein
MSCTLGEKIVMIITMGKHIVKERMNTFLFWIKGFVKESHLLC